MSKNLLQSKKFKFKSKSYISDSRYLKFSNFRPAFINRISSPSILIVVKNNLKLIKQVYIYDALLRWVNFEGT